MASSLAASAGSNASILFRRPIGMMEDNHDDNTNTIFPPVVYTDATYSRGILVANANDAATNNAAAAAGNEHDLEQEVSISIPNDYFVNNARGGVSGVEVAVPRLAADEAARWADSHAAHAAAKRRSPMQIGRLLGTISLGFEERVSAVHDI